jgi:hypothetical protein
MAINENAVTDTLTPSSGTLAVTGNHSVTGSVNSTNTFGFKNRLINGAMVIDQRNAGAAINPAVNGNYCVDRFLTRSSQVSLYKIQQNAGAITPPPGFTNYLGVTSLAATTFGSGDYAFIAQSIEGFNGADLNWGTANAKTVTLSFWVQSSLTGTFGGSFRSYNGANYNYVYSYTITNANTWQYVTVTIPGPTSTFVVNNTNGGYVEIDFCFGAASPYINAPGSWTGAGNYLAPTGQVNVCGTNGATWYITGVQLEVGTQATSFDYRSIGTELALCQRYFQKSFSQTTAPANNLGSPYTQSVLINVTTNSYTQGIYFAVTMRSVPTITAYNSLSASAGTWHVYTSTNTTADATFGNSTSYTSTSMFSANFVGGSYVLAYGDWTAAAEL